MSEFLSEQEIAQFEFMMKQAEPQNIRQVQKEIDFGIPAYTNFRDSNPVPRTNPSVVRRRSENHKRVNFLKIKSSL